LDFLNNINNNEIINIGVTKDEKILGQKLNTGENFLAVGLQRGAFIPLKKDDFLVVDSPYSIGLKQQSRPLMTVKEIGLTRAKNENIRVVLGGNILLINDYSFVKNKSWRLVKKRLEEYPIVVNDRKNTHDILLPTVLDEVNKYNSLLFLVGSKSWAPALICAKCRGIVRCSSCGQTLSVVSSSELKCSHCGLKTSYPKSCVSCHWPEFHPIGVGSAGLAHKLKAAYQTDISLISSGNSNIPDKNVVVATEKIINFPRRYFQATVVVDVDWQLAEANINSSWHMLNTLLQLRAVSQSMYVQTYLPDHWIWKAIRTGIDIDIYEQQLEDRKRYNLPPYGETLAFMRTGKSVVELESQYKNICEELGKYMPEIEMGELAIGKNKGSYYAKAYAQCSNRFTYAKKHTLRKLLPLAWSVDYDA
jgi:primosomal protein N' (replication factor Y)